MFIRDITILAGSGKGAYAITISGLAPEILSAAQQLFPEVQGKTGEDLLLGLMMVTGNTITKVERRNSQGKLNDESNNPAVLKFEGPQVVAEEHYKNGVPANAPHGQYGGLYFNPEKQQTIFVSYDKNGKHASVKEYTGPSLTSDVTFKDGALQSARRFDTLGNTLEESFFENGRLKENFPAGKKTPSKKSAAKQPRPPSL